MRISCRRGGAYEGDTAVSTGCDLGLVSVDEDLGVAEGTTATVTADDSGLCPADRLLVNELNGGHWAGLDDQLVSFPMFLSPRSSDKWSLARHFTGSTHLNFHDGLLEARANHGLLARLLASSPGGSTVRRLEAANALGLGGILLHQTIPNSMAIGQSDIGLGDIGLDRGRVRVIGLRAVLGKPGHGGGVGADGKRAERCQGREATTAGHHGGRIESCRGGEESRWGRTDVD